MDYETLDYLAIQTTDKHLTALSQDYNLTLVKRIAQLDNYYLFSQPKKLKRHVSGLLQDFSSDSRYSYLSVISNRIQWSEHQIPQKRLFKRVPPTNSDRPLVNSTQIAHDLGIVDPGFDQQWHLINKDQKGHDLNLTGVWLQGITGKGVVVTLLDDGVDYEHPDLKNNFFAEGSYDFNQYFSQSYLFLGICISLLTWIDIQNYPRLDFGMIFMEHDVQVKSLPSRKIHVELE
jgi:subtilisin family serine protease